MDSNGATLTIGVDENNFSPSLTADVMVTALYPIKIVEGVDDCKKLTKKQQLELFGKLREFSIYVCLPANLTMIDQLGIYEARNYAIMGAVWSLLGIIRRSGHPEPHAVLVDGSWSKKWLEKFSKECGKKFLTGSDGSDYAIAAASVVGRVYMDALYWGYGKFWPGYGFEVTHGGPTKQHYEMLRKEGPTPIHRTKNYGANWWKKILGGTR